MCCGFRNLIEAFFSPTCTMSGPLWSAMTVSVAERYKTGKENMYSIFGGACTFNTTKWICQLIVPLMALIQPILPLAMAQTLIIQAFGSFYVGINMCRTNVERGVAGITAAPSPPVPTRPMAFLWALRCVSSWRSLGCPRRSAVPMWKRALRFI